MGEGGDDGRARDGVQVAADGVVCGNRRRKRHFRWGVGVGRRQSCGRRCGGAETRASPQAWAQARLERAQVDRGGGQRAAGAAVEFAAGRWRCRWAEADEVAILRRRCADWPVFFIVVTHRK